MSEVNTFQSIIDKIHDIPIRDIIEKHAKLVKAGINYKAKCPFKGHDEKTASFIVNPNKNRFTCYGCGKSGDAITFIQLIRGYQKPWDAIQEIAKEYDIPVPEYREPTPEETAKRKKGDQFKLVYEAAAKFYYDNLKKTEHKSHLDYVLSRTTQAMIDRYEIGLADGGWQSLFNYLRGKGFKIDIIIESGLAKENKDKNVYDFFRNRIMFPVTDRSGSVVAFSGRIIPGTEKEKDQAKFINSAESEIYHKERALFGLVQARNAIAKKGGIYLVEGNFDVTRMVEIGVENTAAACGTAFTEGHIQEIKRYTSNLVLVYDGDAAGIKAIDRSGMLAVENGLNCTVIALPFIDNQKTDPDSYFTSHDVFEKYKEENKMDFIVWKTALMAKGVKNFPDRKSSVISEVSKLILKYENTTRREMYVDECSKIVGPSKLWKKEIDTLTKETTKSERTKVVPEGVSLSEFKKFGFYEEGNCYWFEKGDNVKRGSNFIMKPLFHIQSTINAKRLYEITNNHGQVEVIELLQKELVSLQAFKLRIESLGNFLWEAGDAELNRLKRYLYEKTDTCYEVIQLGWQKQGFFAWANGSFNGEFKPTDNFGITNVEGKKYYIPAYSAIYKNDTGLYTWERNFIHKAGLTVDFKEFFELGLKVYGDNFAIGICYFIATLFRDIIFNKLGYFPILNAFGEKGTGKSEFAVTLLQFFGNLPKGPNIYKSSLASLGEYIGQLNNALAHLDEYRNDLEVDKIEFIKGIFDGTGRSKMDMDRNKRIMTATDAGVILTGQQMPTADPALFSRIIFLQFNQTEYGNEEQNNFDALKTLEKLGLTDFTHSILSHRKAFNEKWAEEFFKSRVKIDNSLITKHTRILENWSIVLSAGSLILPLIYPDFDVLSLEKLAIKLCKNQNDQIKSTDELAIFWRVIESCAHIKIMNDEVDYIIEHKDKINGDPIKPKEVLFLKTGTLFANYLKEASKQNYKPLPQETISHYLEHAKYYLGEIPSKKFKDRSDSAKRNKVYKAIALDYVLLNVRLPRNIDPEGEADEYGNNEELFDKAEKMQKDLPF